MSEQEQHKHKQAIALQYTKNRDGAPRVVAKGQGYVAEQIIVSAKQNSVPIYQSKTLSNLLMAIELDREIPHELYTAVAEVLAYVYRLDQKLKQPRY